MNKTEDTAAYRPPYLPAGIAAIAVFTLYALTLAPSTAFWDTSEYIATAHILGIPHPPGNPLFVLLARTWDIILGVVHLPVAVRINLFSATMGALAHGCWFLLADRVLAFYSRDRVYRLIGASAATLVSATAFTVWNQSNVNEKVYTVSLFTIALLSFLAFRWRDRLGEGKDDNLILLMIFILALSVGNHLMAFLAAPAIVAFILIVEPRALTNWKLYAFAIAAIVLGLSVHLFLPIRAALNPVINEADPRCPNGVASALGSIVTMGKAGCVALSDALARRQYDKPSMFLDPIAYAQGIQAPRSPGLFFAQIANYFQYFDWQWARSLMGNISWGSLPRGLVTIGFLMIGGYGALTNWHRDRKSAAYIAILFLTLSIGLTFYLNFKYGYTTPWADAQQSNTEVRERDYFFMVSFSIWGLWVGIGLAALWQRLSDAMAQRKGRERATAPAYTMRPSWAAAPIMAIALIPLFANWTWASRKGDFAARDWAYNLLMSVEPYGVVFTNGDNDTFPLWYLQEAEGIRKDVTVIVMSYLNTDWYARQLRDLTRPCPPNVSPGDDPTRNLCQRPYVAPPGVTLYDVAGPAGDVSKVAAASNEPGKRAPLKSILSDSAGNPLSDEMIHQIAYTPPFRTGAKAFNPGNIQTTIQEGTALVPADVFLAYIITASLNDRPIYFAMTTQAYQTLNLFDFLLRQGVAFKLNNGPITADMSKGIFEIPGGTQLTGRFIDVPRTETLVDKVFVHHPGFPDKWTHWTDVATETIPSYYAYTYLVLSFVYEQTGQHDKAVAAQKKAEPYSKLTDIRRSAYRQQ
jgi:hypothetical protein